VQIKNPEEFLPTGFPFTMNDYSNKYRFEICRNFVQKKACQLASFFIWKKIRWCGLILQGKSGAILVLNF